MHIVAVHRLTGATDQLARELAAVLGCTPYEARARVLAPTGGPVVVASFAAGEPATACAARLREAGFVPLMVTTDEVENDGGRCLVRQVCFDTDRLQIVTRDNARFALPFAEVALLLCGTGIVSRSEVETKTEKKFDIGRAVVSGGLMMRKKTTTVTEQVSQERQPFCHLYLPGQPPVALRQGELDYSTLGADRQLTREANFNWICAELRRRCPAARWDERLKTRPGQAQLLGPALDPERYLDLAVTLVAKAVLP